MQLLNFYDEHPDRLPPFRFIGLSKKSPFLCYRFLASHPQLLSVSSCHQKLYLSWRPPPTKEPRIYKPYKTMTTELSKGMEAAAKLELDGRLGVRRRVPPDSPVGVSLGRLTGFNTFQAGDLAASDISPTPSISHSTELVQLTYADGAPSPALQLLS